VKTIEGVLREEINQSNLYKISRSISDFESIGLFRCTQLTVTWPKHQSFLDLTYKGNCEVNALLLNGLLITRELKGLNGSIYNINLITNNPSLFYTTLWIVRILGVIIIGLILSYYKIREDKEKKIREIKLSHAKKLIDLESQVSHDIRSPLTALSSSARSWMHLLPEDERITVRSQIQRIQDIANDLLRKRKEIQSGKSGSDDLNKLTPQLLSSCIEEIVTEKRMTFRQYLDLHLEAQVDQTYGIFANINLIEFKRILSNLINNATEAYDDKRGEIKVQLIEDDLNAIVSVSDFGKGIPSDVLKKLGTIGVTHGKSTSSTSGNGLGVAHAMKTVEDWGGTFNIESTVGQGTKVTIIIPKTKVPHWFVSKIELENKIAIVILDDDQGIHQTWDKRFATTLTEEKRKRIDVIHLSTPDDFSSWVVSNGTGTNNSTNNSNGCRYKKILYLCDFELLGHKISGLDLIEKHELKSAAYLVTSHYEEDKIRLRCKDLGVKLIPKMLAGLVPIIDNINVDANTNVENCSVDIEGIQAVLVDDDEYMRKDWESWRKITYVRNIKTTR
ncbi:MAG: HAMP domain-containing histidine kinase, partial [Oligoflexia bacterium]|nr:HAMP domain-containing histidine kinase [Oligoflexia bacterium]